MSRRSTSPTALRPSPRAASDVDRSGYETNAADMDSPGRTRSSPSTGRCATCRSTSPRATTYRRLQEDRRPRQHRVLWHQDRPGRQLRGHRHVRRAHLQVRPQDVGLRRDLLAGQRASTVDAGNGINGDLRADERSTAAAPRSSWEARTTRAPSSSSTRAHSSSPAGTAAHPQGRRDHVLPTTIVPLSGSAGVAAFAIHPSKEFLLTGFDAKIQQVDRPTVVPGHRRHHRQHRHSARRWHGVVPARFAVLNHRPGRAWAASAPSRRQLCLAGLPQRPFSVTPPC